MFAFYVGLTLWAFYRVMGYSFIKANQYVWRFIKKKLQRLDDQFKRRFAARGFNYATYYRARDLALFLGFLFALLVAFPPNDWRIVFYIFIPAMVFVVLIDSVITFAKHLRNRNRGTLTGFLRIYFEPSLVVVAPIFGAGKAVTLMGHLYAQNTLVASGMF
jgi:MFS family permease